MAKARKPKAKRPVESYEHTDKQRANNPPVGLVTPDTDPDVGQKKTYAYDPHLDPQLIWAGKSEHTSFEVPTVSLHVHERIEPRTIIEAVRKRNGGITQRSFFELLEENPPIREAIEFYQHAHGWSNRLIAGDSLLVMNSLLEKEGMAGKVQMIYIDPPYGITYHSNFQPFVNERDVKEKDEDLTQEPEMIRAFRDTWELGIHSYLSYLRDRLLLARELLTETGSIFVQIGDENVHLVRSVMDEVFGTENLFAQINFKSMGQLGQSGLAKTFDYLLWYARDANQVKYRPLFREQEVTGDPEYRFVDDGSSKLGYRTLAEGESLPPNNLGLFRRSTLTSSGFTVSCTFEFDFQGKRFRPFSNKSWRTNAEGMERLLAANRIFRLGGNLYFKRYAADFMLIPYDNSWTDPPTAFVRVYVVQTAVKFVERCLLMTTDAGDLVLDPTCGSGTTAYVAEQWGRRWITCDTSRVALTIAKQRLMTAIYKYYGLAYPEEGVGSGFRYKTVPHVTLKSIANNPDIREGMTREQIDAAIAKHADQETLYDQPLVDKKKVRVSGPFTIEAVPAPAVKSVEELLQVTPQPADTSIARSGETLRQGEWRDELLRAGIRGKKGQHIRFARLEPLPGCHWLHADGETRPFDQAATYDGRSLYPRQVFFPMAGEKEGWAKLARNLKAEIDEELIEAYRGTESLPFEPGDNKRIAVKIVDDRGIESLKILDLE
jgi:adenine-specific DNA-methyltransferase